MYRCSSRSKKPALHPRGKRQKGMPHRDSNPGYSEVEDKLKTEGANRYTMWQMLIAKMITNI